MTANGAMVGLIVVWRVFYRAGRGVGSQFPMFVELAHRPCPDDQGRSVAAAGGRPAPISRPQLFIQTRGEMFSPGPSTRRVREHGTYC